MTDISWLQKVKKFTSEFSVPVRDFWIKKGYQTGNPAPKDISISRNLSWKKILEKEKK